MRPLTRSCFLLERFSLLILFLLRTCLPSLWSLPFPLHALALIPLFLAKVGLSLTFTPSHLTIGWPGQIALFLFPLAKTAPVFMQTPHFVLLRPLFAIRQAQFVQVFPLKPALFCKLSTGLGSTNDSAFFFPSPFLALFLPLCLFVYLKLSGKSSGYCLSSPPLLSSYNGFSDTDFSLGSTLLMS